MVEMAGALQYASTAEPEPQELTDLLAYLALALRQITESVEESTGAWERRGYWVKADRFRHEWRWAEASEQSLASALRSGDLGAGALVATELGAALAGVKPRAGQKHKRPWRGAQSAWESGEAAGSRG